MGTSDSCARPRGAGTPPGPLTSEPILRRRSHRHRPWSRARRRRLGVGRAASRRARRDLPRLLAESAVALKCSKPPTLVGRGLLELLVVGRDQWIWMLPDVTLYTRPVPS